VKLKKASEINGWNGPAHVIAGAFELMQNLAVPASQFGVSWYRACAWSKGPLDFSFLSAERHVLLK
jgi:hypothetical protein